MSDAEVEVRFTACASIRARRYRRLGRGWIDRENLFYFTGGPLRPTTENGVLPNVGAVRRIRGEAGIIRLDVIAKDIVPDEP